MRFFRYLPLLALALLSSCTRSADNGPVGETKMVVRVYEVPADRTDKMKFAVGELLGMSGKQPLGAVSSPGPGQLFVLAPVELQEGIAAALNEIRGANGATPAAIAAAKQLRLDYWNVDALPGGGNDDPALAVLGPALAKIRKNLGDVHFQLNSHASGVSSPGQKASMHYATSPGPNGSLFNGSLEYTILARTEGLQLDINLSEQTPRAEQPGGAVQYNSTGFSSAVIVRLGETIVLSDSPVVTGTMKTDSAIPAKAVRLNVIRVDENPSA